MLSPILIDVILLAVLLLFAALGAKRGFVLTLCSLVAVVVALVGANLAADALAPRLAESLRPRLEATIREDLEKRALEVAGGEEGLPVSEVLATLEEKGGLYEWVAGQLKNTLESGITETAAQTAAAAATAVAEQLARGLIFLAGFFIVLLLWTLLSHALDLVAKLPGINALNRSLGGALGFCKGLVIIYLIAWGLCGLTGFIPAETVEQTHLLALLAKYGPLELFGLL